VAGLKGLAYREIKPQVAKVMEQVGLTHMAHKFIGELSKGYRQRVGLAQALINDPEVLILDEPTIGLDPKQIVEIRSLIKGLAGDRTIVLSSHILPEVSMLCERLIIIDEGKVKAMDTPEKLTSQLHSNSRVQARIHGPSDKIITALKAIDGAARVTSENGSADGSNLYYIEFSSDTGSSHLISRVTAQNNWDLYELSNVKMTLEEIFIKVITTEEGVE
jgi:ABC-2 type transport system ATP-binding protein